MKKCNIFKILHFKFEMVLQKYFLDVLYIAMGEDYVKYYGLGYVQNFQKILLQHETVSMDVRYMINLLKLSEMLLQKYFLGVLYIPTCENKRRDLSGPCDVNLMT